MAVIGTARAVVDIGAWRWGGFLAWLLWGGVHVALLIGFRNRQRILLSWLWGWRLDARDARLVPGDARLDIQVPGRPTSSPTTHPRRRGTSGVALG